MSLLRSHGHVEPQHYPIWMVWEEARIVRSRVNRQHRTLAVIVFQASAAGFAGGKEGVKALNEFLEESFDDADD